MYANRLPAYRRRGLGKTQKTKTARYCAITVDVNFCWSRILQKKKKNTIRRVFEEDKCQTIE